MDIIAASHYILYSRKACHVPELKYTHNYNYNIYHVYTCTTGTTHENNNILTHKRKSYLLLIHTIPKPCLSKYHELSIIDSAHVHVRRHTQSA